MVLEVKVVLYKYLREELVGVELYVLMVVMVVMLEMQLLQQHLRGLVVPQQVAQEVVLVVLVVVEDLYCVFITS